MSVRGQGNLPVIDLALGSPIGLWTLRRFGRRRTGTVFTIDPEIAAVAAAMELAVSMEDPHLVPTGSDRLVSVHYPRVFRPELLDRYGAAYNLHPGLLPWGRGFYPVFWALWENTPAGATLHVMTEAVDCGPIIAQREVLYDDTDTGFTLHRRVTEAEKELLLAAWRDLGKGLEPRPGLVPPGRDQGSYHSRAEFARLRDRCAASDLSSAQLIRLARALTFKGYPGLRISTGDVVVEIAVKGIGAARSQEAPAMPQ